jgi:hypothetical protein
MLRDILKNITLALSGCYDLIASLRPNNLFMYYKIFQAVMLAELHGFKLVLIVHLQTMNDQFPLYRLAVLPTRILTILLYNLRLRKIILGLIFYKDVTYL